MLTPDRPMVAAARAGRIGDDIRVIDPILLTEVKLPQGHPRGGQRCPVFGFLVHHPEGPLLVDTGVGAGHHDIDRLFSPTQHPIEEALARHGVDSREVVMVINSHLHFDHCGNDRPFRDVPMVVQRTEYELAGQPHYTIPAWIDFPGARWELVDGETEVLPGIRVFPTPGHTPGHQSVLVGIGPEPAVIAAQAVYDHEELVAEKSVEPLSPEEAEATSASARTIKAFRPATIYFSHSPRRWQA